MPGWRDLENIWKTFKELDVRPIQEQAEKLLTLAFVGGERVGKSTLIEALRFNARPGEQIISTSVKVDLKYPEKASGADLIVLVLDGRKQDFDVEARLYSEWKDSGRNVLVFYNKMDAMSSPGSATPSAVNVTNLPWSNARFAFGAALEPKTLENDLVPRVLESLPDKHLTLARHFPLFRFAVTRNLIAESAMVNAAYLFSTGFAEIIPMLDIPFNIADVVILTKNQSLMVYKIGLALGLSPRWQDQL